MWSVIELFLDLSAAVQLSQTCKSLHEVIIDEETDKIKVLHLQGDDEPAEAEGKILHALNSVHFPSLKRIHLDFPRRNEVWLDEWEHQHSNHDTDEAACCFPVFAVNLAYARK